MTQATPPTAPEKSAGQVIAILSAANFMIGMGAFMVIGMLIPVAEDLSITAASAGWLLTAYAIGYAVLSPVLVSLTGAIGRRRVLSAGLLIFALSNLAAALSPNEVFLFATRVVAAAGAGLITPIGAAVAAALSPPDRQARALSGVFIGLTLSQVFGVPAGGFIAYTFGWRAAFLVVFLLCVPVLYLMWTRVPQGLKFQPVTLANLGKMLLDVPILLAVSFTMLFVASSYVILTYLGPLLFATMGFEREGITTYLLVSGLGAVVGNLIAGRVTDRIGPFYTLLTLCGVQMCVLPAFSALPIPVPTLFVLGFTWSAFGWSFNAAQQARLIHLAPQSASVVLALNAAALYVGTALGSAVGGVVLLGYGLNALGIGGGIGIFLAALVLVISDRVNRGIAVSSHL